MGADVAVHTGDLVHDALDDRDSEADRSARRRWHPDATWLEPLVLYGAFAISVVMTFGSSPDDPFVTLRYASNLLHGHGAVFNAGQRVNGATSPAGLVLAIFALVTPFGYTYLKLKLLSLLFGVLTLGRARRLLDCLDLPRWGRLVCALSIGLSAPIAFASASGLETTVTSFAITGLLVEVGSRRAFVQPARAIALSALAIAARPEAPLVVLAVLGVALAAERARPVWRRMLWVTGAAAAEAFILIANRIYYRSWLPNTYYAKNVPLHQALNAGITYVMAVLYPAHHPTGTGGALVSVVIKVLWLSFCVGILVSLLRWRVYGYVLAALVAQVAFTLKAGGDWMTGARFLEPTIVSICVLQVLGLVELLRRVQRWLKPTVAVVLAACTVTAASFYAYSGTAAPVTRLSQGVGDQSLIRSGGYVYSDLWAHMPQLLSCARPGDLVAVTEAGYGAFSRLDLRVLDLRGLTSSQVTRAASPSIKGTAGVDDGNWFQPESPIGKVILEDQPRLIVTIDGGAATALDDRYLEFARYQADGLAVGLYEQRGMTCPSPPVSDPRLPIQ